MTQKPLFLLIAVAAALSAILAVERLRRPASSVPMVTSPTSRSAWVMVAPGVEMRTLTAPDSDLGSRKITIVALRCSPTRLRIAAGHLLDAPGWRADAGAVAAVNGGFFDPSGAPVGLLVSGGKGLVRLNRSAGGVFFLRNSRAGIVSAREFRRQFPRSGGIPEAVQCGPVLVKDGEPNHLKPQRARRSGIGVQRDGRVLIAVADEELSLPGWAQAWADRRGLDCQTALNLDGGPSTQFSIRAPGRSLEIAGGWPVPDAVLIK